VNASSDTLVPLSSVFFFNSFALLNLHLQLVRTLPNAVRDGISNIGHDCECFHLSLEAPRYFLAFHLRNSELTKACYDSLALDGSTVDTSRC
jgi:hypothetical protein